MRNDDYYYIFEIYKNSKFANYPKIYRYPLFIIAIIFMSSPRSYESYIYLCLQIFAENMLILFLIIIFTVSPVAAFIRRDKNALYKLIAWLPNILTTLPFSISMISAGSWGSYKHPIIHAVTSSLFESIPGKLYALLTVIFIASYAYLFISKKIKSVEIIPSLVIYLFSILVVYGFAIVFSALASQGAGH